MKQLLLMLFFVPMVCAGQGNVLHKNPESEPVQASISDVAWIAGHWKGEALGGVVEELWSPPKGGSMMGSFKLVVDGKTNFYELQTISEQEGTLVFRIKHFGEDLSGWEPREKPEAQVLLKLTDTMAYFDGITFEKENSDRLNVYVVFEKNGEMSEAKFAYKRF